MTDGKNKKAKKMQIPNGSEVSGMGATVRYETEKQQRESLVKFVKPMEEIDLPELAILHKFVLQDAVEIVKEMKEEMPIAKDCEINLTLNLNGENFASILLVKE